MKTEARERQNDVKALRLEHVGSAIWELPTPALDEATIRCREGMLSHLIAQEAGTSAEVTSAGSTSP
jgi:hypothetical protein